MITETIYVGHNNTFSLQLLRADVAINLMSITGYELHMSNGRMLDDPNSDQGIFTEKADGVVEIAIGNLMTVNDLGTHRAYLITYDPINNQGVRWPDFKLKVRE